MAAELDVNSFQERVALLEREVSRLSEGGRGVEAYGREFVERVVAVLGVGGAFWLVTGENELVRICHLNMATAGVEEGGSQAPLRDLALKRLLETGAPVALPGAGGGDLYDQGLGQGAVNQAANTLLFVPVRAQGKVAAVFLLISPPEVDPRAVRGYLGFVQGLCEQAGVFLERHRQRQLEDQLARAARLREYVSALHQQLDPRRVCYAIANYCQELLGVYRCLAGTFNSGGKFRMESVSGLEAVAVKSALIRSISDVAQQVCRNDKPLLVDNPNAVFSAVGGEAESLVSRARTYMVQAESQYLAVFPVRHDDRVVGALIIEKATDEPISEAEERQIDALLNEAGTALANSLAYRDLPLSFVVRPLGALRDAIYRMSAVRRLIWLAILVVLVAAPALIQRDVKVVGTAELVPVEARVAYAKQDGVIQSVSIPEGRQVAAGQVLATLDTRLIDSEIERVRSQMEETELTLAEESRRSGRGSALARQLESRLKAFQAEYDKLQLQRAQYEITAPVSGTVITRDSVLRQLASRPVNRGDAVVEVVPTTTAWQLLVDVPESEAGLLLQAYDALAPDQKLPARIILNAYPELKLNSTVERISSRAVVEATGERKYRNLIEVWVAEPQGLQEQVEPRQGLEGKVAVQCGRRSLYFAMTHEFANFIRISMF